MMLEAIVLGLWSLVTGDGEAWLVVSMCVVLTLSALGWPLWLVVLAALSSSLEDDINIDH